MASFVFAKSMWTPEITTSLPKNLQARTPPTVPCSPNHCLLLLPSLLSPTLCFLFSLLPGLSLNRKTTTCSRTDLLSEYSRLRCVIPNSTPTKTWGLQRRSEALMCGLSGHVRRGGARGGKQDPHEIFSYLVPAFPKS